MELGEGKEHCRKWENDRHEFFFSFSFPSILSCTAFHLHSSLFSFRNGRGWNVLSICAKYSSFSERNFPSKRLLVRILDVSRWRTWMQKRCIGTDRTSKQYTRTLSTVKAFLLLFRTVVFMLGSRTAGQEWGISRIEKKLAPKNTVFVTHNRLPWLNFHELVGERKGLKVGVSCFLQWHSIG